MILPLWIAFFAGILTVLTPCTFTLLPIIIGGSVKDKNPLRPLIVTGSLMISVIIFTLLLRASTLLIDIHPQTWKSISGGLVIIFGLVLLFPNIWEHISAKLGFGNSSQKLLSKASQKKGYLEMILVGAALGPVFTSCGPTYALILSVILTQGIMEGLTSLIAFSLGLGSIMLLIGYLGQAITSRLRWAANPKGWLKKVLGALFILVGIAIMTGADKGFEAWVLDNSDVFSGVLEIEKQIIESAQ